MWEHLGHKGAAGPLRTVFLRSVHQLQSNKSVIASSTHGKSCTYEEPHGGAQSSRGEAVQRPDVWSVVGGKPLKGLGTLRILGTHFVYARSIGSKGGGGLLSTVE